MSSLLMLSSLWIAPTGEVVMNDNHFHHTFSGAATCGIGMDRDGTQERLLGSIWAPFPGAEWWSLEPETLVGTDFDVKFRNVSGFAPDFQSGWTDDVWTSFISTRHFYTIQKTGGVGTRVAVVEIQIRDKATETLQGSMECILHAERTGGPSDIRLKANIRFIGMFMGHSIYTWTWNAWARSLGINTPTVGVIAQEVLHTGHVYSNNGILMVDYRGLFATSYNRYKTLEAVS